MTRKRGAYIYRMSQDRALIIQSIVQQAHRYAGPDSICSKDGCIVCIDSLILVGGPNLLEIESALVIHNFSISGGLTE